MTTESLQGIHLEFKTSWGDAVNVTSQQREMARNTVSYLQNNLKTYWTLSDFDVGCFYDVRDRNLKVCVVVPKQHQKECQKVLNNVFPDPGVPIVVQAPPDKVVDQNGIRRFFWKVW
jgi:hypothetical protein